MLSGLYPVTLFTAAILGIMIVTASYRCAMRRFKAKVEIGSGEDKKLERLIRAQGNLTEYAPIGVILIGLLEANGTNNNLLMGLSGTFIIARAMHAYGFLSKPGKNFGRFYGTMLTWLTILVASFTGLWTIFLK